MRSIARGPVMPDTLDPGSIQGSRGKGCSDYTTNMRRDEYSAMTCCGPCAGSKKTTIYRLSHRTVSHLPTKKLNANSNAVDLILQHQRPTEQLKSLSDIRIIRK